MGENFYYENAVKGRMINGHIYAIPEAVERETKIALSLDDPMGKSIRFTGRLKVLKICPEAAKKTGLKEGDFFNVNTYVAASPYMLAENKLVPNPSYPSYLLEDFSALDQWNKDNPQGMVPAAGLFHWEQVTFIHK